MRGDVRSVRMHVSMSGFGPVRSKSLEWTLPAVNFSNVLSIYGGHFLDMLFHAVGQPVALSAMVKTQFPDLSVGDGPKVRNESADAVMVMGTLQNGALFQVHIEGGKLNEKGLQIEITGTEGDLEMSNDRSFVTKHHDVVRGAQGGGRGMEGDYDSRSIPHDSTVQSGRECAWISPSSTQRSLATVLLEGNLCVISQMPSLCIVSLMPS